jgi:ribosomal protein S15P/S13E
MALNQLEVLQNIIYMVHEMEVEGTTTVRTPLTQYIYDQEGMKGLRKLMAQSSRILIYLKREYHKRARVVR